MSYFRKLSSVVSSQIFGRPNNLLLRSCFRPVYLESGSDASVEYLHSSKALLKTINELENASNASNYESQLEQEL